MGYKFSQQEILDAAMRAAAASGLSALSFRLVADEAGTSDRVVVYYFGDKTQLITAVLGQVGISLQKLLATGWEGHAGPVRRLEVLVAARAVLTDPDNAWVVRLLLEAVGLAVARIEPFASAVPELFEAWVDWIDAQFESSRRGIAAAIVAAIDGALLTGAMVDDRTAALAWDALIGDARRDSH